MQLLDVLVQIGIEIEKFLTIHARLRLVLQMILQMIVYHGFFLKSFKAYDACEMFQLLAVIVQVGEICEIFPAHLAFVQDQHSVTLEVNRKVIRIFEISLTTYFASVAIVYVVFIDSHGDIVDDVLDYVNFQSVRIVKSHRTL